MITSKRRKFQITTFLIFISFITAHLCFWFLPNVFETWNAKSIDRLFQFRSASTHFQPNYDDTIVHVDLNNTSIQQLNNFYLNRSHHAQVVRNLANMKAAAQLYDFIFAARSNDTEDNAFIDSTSKAGNTYFGLAFELVTNESIKQKSDRTAKKINYLDHTKWNIVSKRDPVDFYIGINPLPTFEALASVSKGLGYLSIKCDPDGVFRRVPLLVRYEDAYYPSFPFRLICDYLGVPPEKIIIDAGTSITLKGAKRPGESAGHDIVIPIDRYGNMRINFIGPWERMKHYNFIDVLRASEDRYEMEIWKEELSGKIVLVSEVSTGSSDVGPVPTDTNFPLSGIHSNVIHDILTESFLRELSAHEMLLVEVILIIIVLFLSLQFSSLYFSLSTIAVSASYIFAASAGLLYGNLIFHIVRPLLMITFALIAIVVYRYIDEEKEKMASIRQRDFIRTTFGRYLSNEVVDELLGSPRGLKMSGEIKEVTFLVSDLRGFTALSSKLSPHEIIDILNRYLDRMVEIIARYRGTVNELEGDGILAFFGAPLSGDDDQERAVACAIEMQNRMVEVNEEQRRLGLPELAMGIGINSGDVVVGNIGSVKRAKYSAIGSPINTAYRIESHTVGGQILISHGTYEAVRTQVNICGTMEVEFKGIDQPLTLHDVIGIEGKYRLYLQDKKTDSFIDLDPPLPVSCLPLEGKTVSGLAISGQITQLGNHGVKVSLDRPVTKYSNLKIILASNKVSGLSEIYAKVVSLEPSDTPSSPVRALLEFTWLPKDIKDFLEERRLKEKS